MVKRLLAIVLLAMGACCGALAQTTGSCQIANNFTGAFQQFPGSYTISVPPGATGTLSAVCDPNFTEYNWVLFNGDIVHTQQVQVTAPSSPGVQAIYGVDACDVDSVTPSCTPGVLITIVTVAPTAPDCTLSASPNPAISGQTVSISGSCNPPASEIHYVDMAGVSRISTSTSFTDVAPTVTQPTVFNIFYHGVAAGTPGVEKRIAITVNPAPPQTCALTGNPNPIFLGQATTLTAQCTGGGAPTNYAFTYPDGTVVNRATNTLLVTPTTAGSFTVSVVASNAGGSAPPSSFAINVQQPSCTISASTPNPVPRNTPVTLTASCNNSPLFFQWTTPSGQVPNANGASITVNPTTTTTYTVTSSNASTISPVIATGTYTVVKSEAAAISNIVAGTITGVPGRRLAASLEVRVTDQSGNPVANELVNWSVVNPGPSPGTFGSNPSPATNAQGITTNTFTMGNDPGGRTLRACLASLPSVCTDFQVVAGASQIAAVAGGPLVGAPGRTLSRELAVQVRDAQGNPVAGETVTWSVVNGGPNPGTFATNPSPPTDAQGVTRNTFTMGSDAGGRTLRACLVTLPTVCADFFVVSLQDAVIRPATKIMQPMAELATAAPLAQIHNIRLHLEQLRLRRNPSVIEALRVSVAGRPMPSFGAFALASKDKDGRPVVQRGGGASADQDPFERLGFFVNGDVEIGKHSATGLQNGYDLNTKGVTAGVDYRLPGNGVIGAALGVMKSDADLADSGGSQDGRGYSFSAYGSFVPATGAYVDVIALGGRNKYDTKRLEPAGTATTAEYDSNTHGRHFAFALTAGADFNRGPVTMNPYVRFDHVDAKIDGFSESGDAGAILVRDLSLRQTVVTLGGQLSYAMSTSWGVLMPNARLELQRRVQGDNRTVNAALLADPTINATAPLEPVDRSYGNVSIGASAVLPKGVSGFFNYERQFGRDNFSNAKYTAGLRFEF